MLRKFSALKNFTLAARDGHIGKVKELYFDDESWRVRYLVLKTGGWLSGRQVLIAPRALGAIDEEHEIIAVHLTRQQVEQSPTTDFDKPLSRQYEERWHRHFGYQGYWLNADPMGLGMMVPLAHPSVAVPADEADERDDPHLRSTDEVFGYSIHATNGDLGHLDDFLVDEEDWNIRYLVITRSWWAGDKVVLAPDWVEAVSWDDERVSVSIPREKIKDAPIWDDSEPMTRGFEEQLYEHYGRERYWPSEMPAMR